MMSINCDVHYKMSRYNPAANYQPNEGRYPQVLSDKDLYKQTIVVSSGGDSKDIFPVRFPNIFVYYLLGQMCVEDKLWMHWNRSPMRLWQTQLNFVVWCASSASGVSSAHLNYSKHPMIRAVYHFHVYYHVRRILKKLQTPLSHETSFNPISTGHFCLVVALGGGGVFHPPSITPLSLKLDCSNFVRRYFQIG